MPKVKDKTMKPSAGRDTNRSQPRSSGGMEQNGANNITNNRHYLISICKEIVDNNLLKGILIDVLGSSRLPVFRFISEQPISLVRQNVIGINQAQPAIENVQMNYNVVPAGSQTVAANETVPENVVDSVKNDTALIKRANFELQNKRKYKIIKPKPEAAGSLKHKSPPSNTQVNQNSNNALVESLTVAANETVPENVIDSVRQDTALIKRPSFELQNKRKYKIIKPKPEAVGSLKHNTPPSNTQKLTNVNRNSNNALVVSLMVAAKETVPENVIKSVRNATALIKRANLLQNKKKYKIIKPKPEALKPNSLLINTQKLLNINQNSNGALLGSLKSNSPAGNIQNLKKNVNQNSNNALVGSLKHISPKLTKIKRNSNGALIRAPLGEITGKADSTGIQATPVLDQPLKKPKKITFTTIRRIKPSDANLQTPAQQTSDTVRPIYKLLQCAECPHKTFSKELLNNHMSTKHASNGIYRCKFCLFNTLNQHALLNHMRVHSEYSY